MDDKTIEKYFSAIQETLARMQEDFSRRFSDIDKRMDRQDMILQSIFEIIKEYDTERKAIKADIWDLKRAVAELQLKVNPSH